MHYIFISLSCSVWKRAKSNYDHTISLFTSAADSSDFNKYIEIKTFPKSAPEMWQHRFKNHLFHNLLAWIKRYPNTFFAPLFCLKFVISYHSSKISRMMLNNHVRFLVEIAQSFMKRICSYFNFINSLYKTF